MGEQRDSEDAAPRSDEDGAARVDDASARGTEDRARRRQARLRDTDEPVLPTISRDETDIGWGDEPGRRDEDWYRRERPPHHE